MHDHFDYKQHSVLYVDDEAQALKYFHKVFSDEFAVLTAGSAEEAWKIANQDDNSIGLVITDQRMPGETGVDLLGRFQDQLPDVVRILTTAYANLDSAIAAVNEGGAFRYITKPWNVDELRGTLMRALEFHQLRLDRRRLLQEKLNVIQRMLILDRVRNVAAAAAALQERFHRSMEAFMAYLEQSPLEERIKLELANIDEIDMFSLARRESEELVQSVQQVLKHTSAGREGVPEQVELVDLVRDLVAAMSPQMREDGVELRFEPPERTAQAVVNVPLVQKMLSLLIGRMCDMDGNDRVVTIRFPRVTSAPESHLIRLTIDTPAWKNGQFASLFSAIMPVRRWPLGMDMDILAAFFIAYHHNGHIVSHVEPPDGPGFEVTIGSALAAPEAARISSEWFDKMFRRLERWRDPATS